MKIKLISLILLFALALTMTSCLKNPEKVIGDFVYHPAGDKGYSFCYVAEHASDKEVYYIPDEVDGHPLTVLGAPILIGGSIMSFIKCTNMKRVYFPWSIEETSSSVNWPARTAEESRPNIVICASTSVFIDMGIKGNIYIVPNFYYKTHQFCINNESVFPANVSYLFNYENNPNEGYFFVDLVEESGSILKPPYDPKQEGSTFAGWYKDPECLTPWNFDTDVITIEFDDAGNRIYEEVCLYAKWIKN